MRLGTFPRRQYAAAAQHAGRRPDVRRFTAMLAAVMLAGPWNYDAVLDRVDNALQRPGGWIREVVRAAMLSYSQPPAKSELAAFLTAAPPLPQVWTRLNRSGRSLPQIRKLPRPTSADRMGVQRWPVPEWHTVADLAGYLGLTAGELAWFADVQERHRRAKSDALRHYRYRMIPRSGGRYRLIEAPKWQLREIQRRILHDVLQAIPVHDAVHGFRPGRSARTFAEIHSGQDCVVRMDMESYFSSIGAGRIHGVFRSAGYSDPVATVLTGLTTTRTPRPEREPLLVSADAADRRLGAWLAVPHLPQGAPTSPMLANLVTYRLDRRLRGLAERFGAIYARYADDIAFSGMPRSAATALTDRAQQVIADEGFAANAEKSLVRAACSRQVVTGLVVNAHPNLARAEFDRLKAILHNCAVHGPRSQNRSGHPDWRAHLLGRVSWAEFVNPAKGARLRRIFDSIDWT